MNDKMLKISIIKNSDNAYLLDDDGDRGERRIRYTSDFNFESVRLASFYYFKYKSNYDIEIMARRGFYYSRVHDLVICHFCSVHLLKNEDYKEPLEHTSNYNCPMAISPLNGNVPLIDANPDLNHYYPLINRLFREIYKHKITSEFPDEHIDIPFDVNLFENNIFKEDFSDYNKRLSTFKWWFVYLPENEGPKKELFAKAGFVYTGVSDIVMCFKCKGGLFNISKDDDPLQDHINYYGHCTFIQEYQDENVPRTDQALVKTSKQQALVKTSKRLTGIEEDLLISHPMVEFLLFQNYGKSLIKTWIVAYVNILGCLPATIDMCRTEFEKIMILIWVIASKSK